MPSEPTSGGRVARFGVFEADLKPGELRREGRRVPLQEHPFQVLAALLEQPGREVSLEDLRRRLWPHRGFLDFENGINTAVARLRQALGDSAENPRFIGTRRGRGYRFIAPVEWTSVGTSPEPPKVDSVPVPAEPSPSPAGPPRPGERSPGASPRRWCPPSHRFPFFLPDGRHFPYLVLRADRDQSEIRWAQLGGPDGGRLLAAESNAVYAAPGSIFFARGSSLYAQAFDAGKLHPIGPPLVVNERVGVYGEDGPTGLGMFSASSDTIAMVDVPRPPRRLTWTDRQGRRLGATGPPGRYTQVDLSPDGARAAVVRLDYRRRTSDVSILDLRTGVETIITDDPWPDSDPVWSPRGDRLAFGSLREGRWSAFVGDPTRVGQDKELPVCAGISSWFPDGNSVLCPTLGNTTALWEVPLDAARAAAPLVLGLTYAEGRISPDGSLLAYSSDHEGRRRVYVLALGSGSSRPVALADGVAPRWRHDGRELFFLSGRMLTSVFVSRGSQPEFGRAQPLFEAPLPPSDSLEDFLGSFAVWPDGSKFLFATATTTQPAFAIEVEPHWTPARAR